MVEYAIAACGAHLFYISPWGGDGQKHASPGLSQCGIYVTTVYITKVSPDNRLLTSLKRMNEQLTAEDFEPGPVMLTTTPRRHCRGA